MHLATHTARLEPSVIPSHLPASLYIQRDLLVVPQTFHYIKSATAMCAEIVYTPTPSTATSPDTSRPTTSHTPHTRTLP